MLCLKEKCHYYVKCDDLEMCDLVVDDVLSGDKCIGCERIQKEMDDVMRDIKSAFRKYEKLQRLKARIKVE